MNIRILFVNFFLLSAFNFVKSQNWSLKLSSNVEIRSWKLTDTYEKEEHSLQGASIILTSNNQVVAQTTSDGNGDFTINVPPNNEFVLTVSYPGYNTKRFDVNTRNVPDEITKDNFKPTFSIGGFIMAKPFVGIDYSGLNQPLIKIEYNSKNKKFVDNQEGTLKGVEIINKIAFDENTLIQNFCSTNKAGDAALAKPDCMLAKTLYQKAMTIIPFEAYPVDQLKKVSECLKNKEEKAKKVEDARNGADKAAKQKEGLAKSIAEDEAEARAIEEKRTAKEKKLREKKEKEKEDKLAAKKVAEEKQKEKAAKQKEGLAKSLAEDEAEARAIEEKRTEKEKELREKKAKEKETKEKAKAENDAETREKEEKKKTARDAKAADEKAKEVQRAQGKGKYSLPQTVFGQDDYKVAIKKADDYFKMKRWSEAKPAYEEALKYKADDPYAKSKLEQVNKNLNATK